MTINYIMYQDIEDWLINHCVMKPIKENRKNPEIMKNIWGLEQDIRNVVLPEFKKMVVDY